MSEATRYGGLPVGDMSGTMADLPPPNTNRWVVRRKAEVLAALRSGAITMEEACRRYALSEEELLAWQRAFEAYGLPGCAPLAFGLVVPVGPRSPIRMNDGRCAPDFVLTRFGQSAWATAH